MRIALAAGLALGFAAAAAAQALVDPTRPPQPAAARSAQDAERRPAGPVLQSVLISPARRIAVISGRTVALGDKYGAATVASISESAVVLSYGNRRQTLHLVPDVDRRVRAADEAARPLEGSDR